MAAAEAMAAATLERLEALSCPLVLGGPPRAPPAALELLCRPSPTRWALLCWAGVRVYPPLSAELESLTEEQQMKALAALGVQLMLCGPRDLALLQGTAPPSSSSSSSRTFWTPPPPLETPPESSPPTTTPFLLELLETPEGGAALRPPRPPPIPEEFSKGPPRPRRPLPELEAELGGVRRGLEELQAQVSNLGGSSTPDPPNLGVLGGALTSLAADFGASELRGPPGPPGTPKFGGWESGPPCEEGAAGARPGFGDPDPARGQRGGGDAAGGGQRGPRPPNPPPVPALPAPSGPNHSRCGRSRRRQV